MPSRCLAAAYAALQLQREICQGINQVEIGFYGGEFYLLGEYSGGYDQAGFPDLTGPASEGNLEELARRVQALDAKLRRWLEERSIALNILDSEMELDRFLTQRDPSR